MALDLTTVDAGPIFLTRSRINTQSRDFGTFTATSMQALLRRIVDGDRESFWHSATGDDLTTEVLEFTVQLRSAKIARPINFVALSGINWKNFKVEWKAGAGSFAIIPGFNFTVTENTDADIFKTFTKIIPDTYKITIDSTFAATPDVQKILGSFYPANEVLQLSRGFQTYRKSFREKVRKQQVGNGKEFVQYRFRSAVSYEHYQADVVFNLVPRSERNILRQIKREGDPFVWIPEPITVLEDIFTCRFGRPWTDSYESMNTEAGYTIPNQIKEVGDL